VSLSFVGNSSILPSHNVRLKKVSREMEIGSKRGVAGEERGKKVDGRGKEKAEEVVVRVPEGPIQRLFKKNDRRIYFFCRNKSGGGKGEGVEKILRIRKNKKGNRERGKKAEVGKWGRLHV